MVCDTVFFVNTAIKEGKKVVIEGANAAMLDIDHGERLQIAPESVPSLPIAALVPLVSSPTV